MPHDDRDIPVCMRDYVLAHLQNCFVRFVCMEQLGSKWMDFYEILYLIVFKNKSVKNIQILASDKNNGYCT